jgi:hypothetical protein
MKAGVPLTPVTIFDREDPYKIDKLMTVQEDVAPTPVFPYVSYRIVISSSKK